VPVVQFLGVNSPIPVPYWVWEKPERRKLDKVNKNEFSGAYIKQIPLVVANAMTGKRIKFVYILIITVHKVQGLTLAFAKIDIGSKTFEYGQAYTALSRLKSMKGLSVLVFDRYAFKTNPKVLNFYKRYAGEKSTIIPDSSKLFEEELQKSAKLDPFDPVFEDPNDYDKTLVLKGNYYEIFSTSGIAITFRSSSSDIKRAYKLLCLSWHPDKCKFSKILADINFKTIQNCYEVLKDDLKRAQYNTTL
jgi:hypothetical protein